QRQLVGVFSPKYTEKMAKVLQAIGSKHALIVSGLDGLDEISLTAPTQVSELKNGQVDTYTISPKDFGLSPCTIEDLEGGTPKENAAIIVDILQGNKSVKRSIVEINAAAVLYVAGKTDSLNEGLRLAVDVIDSGLALQKLQQVAKSSQEVKTNVS